MWLYRSGNDGKNPIVLYDYQPSRNGNHAVNYLKDLKGYIHSDGYSGYNKLTDIIRVGCWAHLRRKFVEAIPQKTNPDGLPTSAETGRQYCDKLFAIEDTRIVSKTYQPKKDSVSILNWKKQFLRLFGAGWIL